jgi:hypothetical protein
MLERRVQFPRELISSFGSEGPGVTLENTEENLLFLCLYHIEQHIDQLRAYRHVEKNWLSRDIKTMAPAEYITLAKEINRFAADALVTVKDENGAAGEFLERGVTITLETGIPDVEFDSKVIFNFENYEILKQIHGKKVADDYQLFSILLELECDPLKDQPWLKQLEYWENVVENYEGTAGLQAYQRVKKYINPKTAAVKMEIFSQALEDKIAAMADPIHCAAFALSQLSAIHSFAHANRRSARIFMNTLLMMLGRAPILIPPAAVSEYYLAMEKSTALDVTELEALLRLYANQVTQGSDNKLSVEFVRKFNFENKLEVDVTEFKYLFTPIVPSPFFNYLSARIIDSKFYLEQANKYVNSAPKVAKFYYERSKRLAKTDALNPTLGAAILAAQHVTAQPSNQSGKLKPIYAIAPHETARLSAADAKHAGLFHLLQPERLAILIKDKHNTISLTSLDSFNSLDFILREAKAMRLKAGEFTIDIIRHSKDVSNRAKIVKEYIEKEFGTVKNSKGSDEIRVSETGTVLILIGKILMPDIEQTLMRLSFLIFESRYVQRSTKINPLEKYELFEGSKPMKLRATERIVMRALQHNHKEQPIVVFDNEWTGNFPILSADAKEFLSQTARLDPNSKQFANKITHLFSRVTNDKGYFNEIIKQVKLYHDSTKGALFSNLNRFFKAPETELPDKAIALITSYAESEALGSFRMRQAGKI